MGRRGWGGALPLAGAGSPDTTQGARPVMGMGRAMLEEQKEKAMKLQR
jgi:hypothetical protein